jgi:hypothetical protein
MYAGLTRGVSPSIAECVLTFVPRHLRHDLHHHALRWALFVQAANISERREH